MCRQSYTPVTGNQVSTDKEVRTLISHGQRAVALHLEHRRFQTAIDHIRYLVREIDELEHGIQPEGDFPFSVLNVHPAVRGPIERAHPNMVWVSEFLNIDFDSVMELDNFGKSRADELAKELKRKGFVWPRTSEQRKRLRKMR